MALSAQKINLLAGIKVAGLDLRTRELDFYMVRYVAIGGISSMITCMSYVCIIKIKIPVRVPSSDVTVRTADDWNCSSGVQAGWKRIVRPWLTGGIADVATSCFLPLEFVAYLLGLCVLHLRMPLDRNINVQPDDHSIYGGQLDGTLSARSTGLCRQMR